MYSCSVEICRVGDVKFEGKSIIIKNGEIVSEIFNAMSELQSATKV